jgi:hypothetical protein
MYRFLIAPAPPESVQLGNCPGGANGCTVKTGIDSVILEQRKAFLRPDSVVAILILSDENDCSIIDEGQGWLVGQSYQAGRDLYLPRATSACAVDTNDPCCQSCAISPSIRAAGCAPVSEDPECQKGSLTKGEDVVNLRCFDQKRRFGFDLLYPVARYVNALREPIICPHSRYRDLDCSCRMATEQALSQGLPEPPCTSVETGEPVPNPLYSNLSGEAAFARDPSQVYLSGIVGIPWQDLATPETLSDPTRLEYLTAQAHMLRGEYDEAIAICGRLDLRTLGAVARMRRGDLDAGRALLRAEGVVNPDRFAGIFLPTLARHSASSR